MNVETFKKIVLSSHNEEEFSMASIEDLEVTDTYIVCTVQNVPISYSFPTPESPKGTWSVFHYEAETIHEAWGKFWEGF